MDDEKSIKDLMRGLLNSYQLGDKYDEISVVNSWEQIAGNLIARKTSKIFIKNRILHLSIDSAPLKSELLYHKLVIIEKVNTFAGKELIKDLQIH
ncbi:DUF721 domain-containing protein [bacterium]|nr:DUF721 domain-containing protein [bacterium]